MLSYRHAFHAGNHADILKHSTLTLLLQSLLKKDKPVTLFDTHAGAGVYNLDDERLLHTGEADAGILKLLQAAQWNTSPAILTPYISLCGTYRNNGLYPGSPEIERSMLRHCDKIFVSELHTSEISVLKKNMQEPPLVTDSTGCPNMTILHKNGFEMLHSLTPPRVRRGLVLIDPSYETDNDYHLPVEALFQLYKKWNTAVTALWYPLLTHRKDALSRMKTGIKESVTRAFKAAAIPRILYAELYTASESCCQSGTGKSRLYGSGMMIINTPWQTDTHLKAALEWITPVIAPEGGWSVQEG